jgi:hypothetical protein
MSPARCTDIVRKLCRSRISEAYPCREKWREILSRVADFWLPNALLTANLCDNSANLADKAQHRPTAGIAPASPALEPWRHAD